MTHGLLSQTVGKVVATLHQPRQAMVVIFQMTRPQDDDGRAVESVAGRGQRAEADARAVPLPGCPWPRACATVCPRTF